LRVGIVGCGLIGRRRADVVCRSPGDQLVIVADVDEPRARSLAGEMGCLATTDWQEVVARDDVEAVVVSTPNKYLMPITVAALEHGKHVLVEKPMARNLAEAEQVLRVARRQGDKETRRQGDKETRGQGDKGRGGQGNQRTVSPSPSLPLSKSPYLPVLGVGFNHRHHPAIWKAYELCTQAAIGPLMFIRAVYGHGGRPGYEKEWRANPEVSGGGELLDQGVHIVDVCRWFMGDFAEAFGFTSTYFWMSDRRPPTADGGQSVVCGRVEDNAFALLRTADGRVAQFHTSWTQWKNLFTFEVFGRDGYVRVDGLGGSYGTETLIVGHRRPQSGPPVEERFEFHGPDLSWQAEWQEFTSAIREDRQPLANGEDGLQVMRLIDAIYESARTGTVVRL